MKLIACLILSMFLCNTAAGDSTGKFTFLGEGACAPFEGTLFDVDATAEIVILPTKLKKDCNLKLNFELGKLRTDLQLEIDNLQIHYDSTIQEKDLIIASQLSQIEQMQTAIRHLAPNNKWLWFTGGVVAGIAVSYGAYEVFN